MKATAREGAETPDGWYAVAFSTEITRGRLITRTLAGEDVVVYRTARGVLRAVRPHCPHLGAHLGHGGRVVGESVVCPFHGFAYGPDGTCVRTPYSKRPPRAALHSLPVRELHGLIWGWHNADGAQPTWEPVEVSEAGFTGPARLQHSFRGHQHDFVENIVDIGHFGPVHRARAIVQDVSPDGPVLRGSVTLDGFHNLKYMKDIKAHLHFQCAGLGQVVAEFAVPSLGLRLLQVAGLTPEEPGKLNIRTVTRANARYPALTPLLSRVVNWATLAQFRADIPIWENRRFTKYPKLVAEDGPIMLVRKWAEQFYGTHV
ncbi:Rieske 2Fe-2S domain-containing protein [Streptomyces sp. NPDC002092]